MLKADLDENTTIHVSPIARQTYEDYIEADNLGGHFGYFIMRTIRRTDGESFEVLAKAPSFEAAGDLFDMIVTARRR